MPRGYDASKPAPWDEKTVLLIRQMLRKGHTSREVMAAINYTASYRAFKERCAENSITVPKLRRAWD